MLKNLNKPYPFYDDLIYNIKAIIGISLGVFLFILFFQPIEFQLFDFNEKLLVITGFGGIAFGIFTLCLVIFPSIFPKIFLSGRWKLYKDILLNLIIWALTAVAFNFYARYVGLVSITFAVSFRIVLLSLIPVIILIVIHQFNILKRHLQNLMDMGRQAGLQLQTEPDNAKIAFKSENKSENFEIFLADLVLVRSANNYIEIVYKKNNQFSKNLIRSTLKNTEALLLKFPSVIRCHRTTLINLDYVLKFGGQPGNMKLILKDCNEDVSVSRQYLEQVKEALK